MEPPAKSKRNLTPKPLERAAFLALIDSGLTIEQAIAQTGVSRSSGFRWARVRKQARQQEQSASAPAASPGNVGPRELLSQLSNDPKVLPAYRVNAARALLALDSGAKEERIIPSSVLDWLESLDGQEVDEKPPG